jgi:NAD(P)-dependent dehydrogenase (short-subunit alcohol dehydrogenase family)
MPANLSLTGRTAVVTGASRGIGRAIALRLAEHGADVVAAARSEEHLTSLKGDIEGLGRKCSIVVADVTADDAATSIVDAAMNEFGRIDALVNNAGGNSFSIPVQSMRMSGWEKTMAFNVTALVHLTQQAIPALIASGNGSIVNISSVAGLRGAPLMSHYGAAKAAVISFTRSLSVELAQQGVRVNALLPGWIETDLTGFLRTDSGTEQGLLSRVPMGRWGRSEEIADAALFLVSDASSFMTGQELIVDGGLGAMP